MKATLALLTPLLLLAISGCQEDMKSEAATSMADIGGITADAQPSKMPDLESRSYSNVEYSAGENPYKVKRYAPQYFVDHGKHFAEGVTKHPSANIWSISPPIPAPFTIHVIEAPDGLIVIDSGFKRVEMEPVAEKIKKLSDKPIKAVIFTHAHVDHTGGILAIVSKEQVENGEVEIIASEKFMDAYTSENAATGPLMGQRATVMYGGFMQPADAEQNMTGCCGKLGAGESDFIPPTKTVGNEETLTVAGMELEFAHSGGENAAHIIVYSPTHKAIFIGDELQGPAAPQLHSPRGTKFRNTDAWVAAIDKIRAFEPEHMLPGHGKAVYGGDEVNSILVTYRDAMQFQHDQSIRLINQGKSPDDLANEVVVPDYLTLDPYTIETYGNTKTNVRSFFTGYVSWFDGNAANLDPLPKVDEDKRLVEAMGGRDKVLKLAEKALNDGEIKWAVALSDKLVRINNKDMAARYVKAAGFRHLGYATYNSTNRGFYLSGADELDGILDINVVAKIGRQFTMAEGVIKGLPTDSLIETLRYKVLPENVKATDTGYYFNFTDTEEEFTLRLRNGILEVTAGKHPHDVNIETNRKAFNKLFIDEVAPSIEKIGKVKGAKGDIARFDKAIDFTFHPTRLAIQ